MEIAKGRKQGGKSEQRDATFTGAVWRDPVLGPTDGVSVNDVFFAPGARTYWHSHGRGQILQVLSGRGLVCSEGGTPQEMRPGDTVWVPAGERHWHGGSPDSYVVHTAISLGEATWMDEVGDAEFAADEASGSSS